MNKDRIALSISRSNIKVNQSQYFEDCKYAGLNENVYEIILFAGILLLLLHYILNTIRLKKKHKSEMEILQNDLKQSQDKYKFLVENSSDVVLILINGNIKLWNKKILNKTGYSEEELIDKPVIDFVFKDDITKFEKYLKNLSLGNNIPENLEFRIIIKDGSIIWINSKVLRFETHEGYGVLAVVSDINRRRDYEVQFQQALLKEKEFGELKSGVLLRISHDYRTPLTVIQTCTELLKVYYQSRDDSKFLENIDRITKSINGMIKFLEDILFLGKMETKSITASYEEVNIEKLIKGIIQNVNSLNHGTISESYEFTDDASIMKIEPNLLSVALVRLLTNSAKFNDEAKKVHCIAFRNDGVLEIKIINACIGYASGKLEDLYKPYNQTTMRDVPTEIVVNLSIAKACLDMINGKIEINITEGNNADLLISVPLNN